MSDRPQLSAVTYEDNRVVIEANGIEVAVVSLDSFSSGFEGDVVLLVRPVEHHTPDQDWPAYRVRGLINSSHIPERFQVNETIGRLMLATMTDTHMKGSTR
jgi:hypothetical protein